MPAPASPSRLSVRFWGVRGSLPTCHPDVLGTGGNTACVEVTVADGPTVVLDLGTGARALGADLLLRADGQPLDLHVFLSHFHWDHIQGLPFFAPLYAAGHRLTFYASGTEGAPAALLAEQMRAPFFPVEFGETASEHRFVPITPDAGVQVGPLTVQPFAVHHTQDVLGFRLDAHGASVVYLTDYEHGDAATDAHLRTVAAGADLLICDAQYTPEEYALYKGWGHTTWEEAARLATDAGVERLALFHHDPSHSDAVLAGILAAAQAHFPLTMLAAEGVRVDL